MNEPTNESPPSDKSLSRRGDPIRKIVVLWRWARRLILQSLPPDEARRVRASVDADGKFTERFALMCALSAGIATLGLLQSSAAVVIGAMLVSPLMGPIAALGFSFASIDGRRVEEAAKVIAIGAGIGIATGMLITGASPIRNATPEILARTAPNLLDLAVALLSGLAGGYATVHQKGETAIGVAIATALMPPLATLGYSLAVLRFDFAAGAGLLFLTNLAAISFSFAFVARLRGVARPLQNVEFKPLHVALGIFAFLCLAAPLALTLQRVAQEAFLTSTVRREVVNELKIDASQIAQLSVNFPFIGEPKVSVTAITPEYKRDAEANLTASMRSIIGSEPDFTFRQVVAADLRAQTQAMIDAAIDARNLRASASEPPSIEAVRARSHIPIMAAWVDTASNTVLLAPADLPTLPLAAYRAEESRLDDGSSRWRIAIIPPFRRDIFLNWSSDAGGQDRMNEDDFATALWAIRKWGLNSVQISAVASSPSTNDADRGLGRLIAVSTRLSAVGISVASRSTPLEPPPSPTSQGSMLEGVWLHILANGELSARGTSDDTQPTAR